MEARAGRPDPRMARVESAVSIGALDWSLERPGCVQSSDGGGNMQPMGDSMALPAKRGEGGPPPVRRDDSDLFASINPPRKRGGVWVMLNVSAVAHVAVFLALILIPLYWPEPSPTQPNDMSILIFNPPPPPPLPLPKGNPALKDLKPAQPVTPDPQPVKPAFTAPADIVEPSTKEARAPEIDQAGITEGSDSGVPEGMEGGVPEGQVGGVLGGVIGGVPGGTGTIVQDYDQPPRLLKKTTPKYPQEAFVKRVEGTVLVEILIDSSGRVIQARIIKSVPLLDAAAVQTVRQWLFAPAIKGGRPVATLAHAPVTFRIY
jgi:protein TonB